MYWRETKGYKEGNNQDAIVRVRDDDTLNLDGSSGYEKKWMNVKGKTW